MYNVFCILTTQLSFQPRSQGLYLSLSCLQSSGGKRERETLGTKLLRLLSKITEVANVQNIILSFQEKRVADLFNVVVAVSFNSQHS